MNKAMGRLIESRLQRRTLLRTMLSSTALACIPKKKTNNSANSPFTFRNLPPQLDKDHHVSEGYKAQILLSWGDPLFAAMEDFDWKQLNAEEQARRFGYNNDYLAYIELEEGRGLLFVNHESTIAG